MSKHEECGEIHEGCGEEQLVVRKWEETASWRLGTRGEAAPARVGEGEVWWDGGGVSGSERDRHNDKRVTAANNSCVRVTVVGELL